MAEANEQAEPVGAAWAAAAIAIALELDDGHTDVRTIADAAMTGCVEYKSEMITIFSKSPAWSNDLAGLRETVERWEDGYADDVCTRLLRERKAAAAAAPID